MDPIQKNIEKTANGFVWENIWVLESKEFSNEETRHRRSKRKVENLHRLGIQFQEGQRLVDLGSGTGDVALLLHQQFNNTGFETFCVEKSPNAAIKLRSKIKDLPSIQVIESDVCSIPLQSGSFDIALAISIIEHVKTDTMLLQEIHRILRSGGELYLCQSNSMSANYLDWLIRKVIGNWPYGYQKFYSIPELTALLEPWFVVEKILISFPDTQSPFYLLVDRILNFFIPSWGRNIFWRARRKENKF